MVAALVLSLLMPVGPTRASAATETFVTMVSDPYDYIGGGEHRVFHPGNSSIRVTGNAASLEVSVVTGEWMTDSYVYFDFSFRGANGAALEAGEYPYTEDFTFGDPSYAGMHISGEHRACAWPSGRFRVNDITTGADGSITSLWIIYVQGCDTDLRALQGEIRYQVADDGGAAVVGAREFMWDAVDPNVEATVAPFTVLNPGTEPIAFGPSSLSGTHASEFFIDSDECVGRVLEGGATCAVWVGFDTARSGEKHATLSIPEIGGATHEVRLEGFVYPGITNWELHSNRGAYSGSGCCFGSYYYDPTDSLMDFYGSERYVHGWLTHTDGSWGEGSFESWSVDFWVPLGEEFVVGKTYVVDNSDGPYSGGPSMYVSDHQGSSCGGYARGEFTISDIGWDEYGHLERFGVKFDYYCAYEGKVGIHGVINYRVPEPTPKGGPYAVDVVKVGNGVGTVASTDGRILCGIDCTEGYDYGTTVELTATASPGSAFTGWSGPCSGRDPCRIKAATAHEVTATFVQTHLLTVTKQGTGRGRVASGRAIDCGADCTETYNHGTATWLNAEPDYGSRFAGWSGACSGTSSYCSVTMDQARHVTATFELYKYPLTVSKTGTGSGTVTSDPAGTDCGSDCTENYDYGSVVTLTAAPAEGSTFTGWSGGGCSGTATTCSVSVYQARYVNAAFTADTYSLDVTKSGTGSGTVTGTGIDCGADCREVFAHGTVVALSAAPASGSTFEGWSGACSGTGSCEVTMTQVAEVTGAFTLSNGSSGGGFGGGGGSGGGASSPTPIPEPLPITHSLSVATDGSGSGSIVSSPAGIECGTTCAAEFAAGTNVVLSAVAAEGSAFTGWGGACAGLDECELTMDQAYEAFATFDTVLSPSDVTVTHAKTRRRVNVSGDVVGEQPSGSVTVTFLKKRRDGTWRRIDRRKAFVSESSYVTAFDRPSSGKCRVNVRYPGDARHLPSSASAKFAC